MQFVLLLLAAGLVKAEFVFPSDTTDETCTCVPFHRCDNQEDLIHSRVLDGAKGTCSDLSEICCPPEHLKLNYEQGSTSPAPEDNIDIRTEDSRKFEEHSNALDALIVDYKRSTTTNPKRIPEILTEMNNRIREMQKVSKPGPQDGCSCVAFNICEEANRLSYNCSNIVETCCHLSSDVRQKISLISTATTGKPINPDQGDTIPELSKELEDLIQDVFFNKTTVPPGTTTNGPQPGNIDKDVNDLFHNIMNQNKNNSQINPGTNTGSNGGSLGDLVDDIYNQDDNKCECTDISFCPKDNRLDFNQSGKMCSSDLEVCCKPFVSAIPSTSSRPSPTTTTQRTTTTRRPVTTTTRRTMTTTPKTPFFPPTEVDTNPPINPGPTFDDCECVQESLCPHSTVEVVELDQSQLDDYLKGRVVSQPTGRCGKIGEVCCPKTGQVQPDQPSACKCVPQTQCTRQRIRNVPCSKPYEVCCDSGDNADSTCGFRNAPNPLAGMGYFGEFPWTVGIVKEELSGYIVITSTEMYHCDGALIHPQVVLTTAHCATTRGKLSIRAGQLDTKAFQKVYVRQAINHPNYDPNTFVNDIALLYLERPLQLNKYVNVICLPPPGVATSSSTCHASGRRSDSFNSLSHNVPLPVISREACQAILRTNFFGMAYNIHPSFVCTQEMTNTMCKGYMGSPLACPVSPSRDKFYLTGLFIKNMACRMATAPDVFVNVGLFRDWINMAMKTFNLDSSYYQA